MKDLWQDLPDHLDLTDDKQLRRVIALADAVLQREPHRFGNWNGVDAAELERRARG